MSRGKVQRYISPGENCDCDEQNKTTCDALLSSITRWHELDSNLTVSPPVLTIHGWSVAGCFAGKSSSARRKLMSKRRCGTPGQGVQAQHPTPSKLIETTVKERRLAYLMLDLQRRSITVRCSRRCNEVGVDDVAPCAAEYMDDGRSKRWQKSALSDETNNT